MVPSAQRLPPIQAERPAPVEWADKVRKVARRVRWMARCVVHLRCVVAVLAAVAVVETRTYGVVPVVFGAVLVGVLLVGAESLWLSALMVLTAVGVVVWSLSWVTGFILVVGLVGVIASPVERANIAGLWWRYRASSDFARIGIGADGDSSEFATPELVSVKVTPSGRVYRVRTLRLVPGEVEAAALRLRQRWAVHKVIVTEPGAGWLDITVIRRDPFATPFEHRLNGPTAVCEDGSLYHHTVASHVLLGGTTGSGKSTWINAIMATLPDQVRVYGIDMKRIELAPWRERCVTVALTTAQAFTMLKDVFAIMESREADMETRRIRTFDGDDILVVVDEVARLFSPSEEEDDLRQLVDVISSQGRASKVWLLLATQSPDQHLFAPYRTRDMMTRRIACRVTSPVPGELILGVKDGGADLLDHRRPGLARMIVPGKPGFVTARAVLVDDTQVPGIITGWKARILLNDDAVLAELHTAPGPAPENSSPTTAPPSEAPAAHNDQREAGAPFTDHEPLAPIPVTDADLLDYLRVPEEDQPLHMQLLTESSGEPIETLIGRIAALLNPPLARGEIAPTFPDPTQHDTTSGRRPTGPEGLPNPEPTIAADGAVVLRVPRTDPRRYVATTGRYLSSAARFDWSDGTTRNYPETAAA